MTFSKIVLPVFAAFALSAVASADSVTIQLGAGSLSFTGTGIADQVQESGAIITPTLTLNVPLTSTFYTALYGANCTTCGGTSNLTASLVVTDTSPFGTGSGSFSQPFNDTAHTFTPLAGAPINIVLNNGDTLTITPLAGAPVLVAGNGSENVSATFLLSKTVVPSAVPEPSTVLLIMGGLIGAGCAALRKRS